MAHNLSIELVSYMNIFQIVPFLQTFRPHSEATDGSTAGSPIHASPRAAEINTTPPSRHRYRQFSGDFDKKIAKNEPISMLSPQAAL